MVKPGTIINDHYVVICVLGKGYFSETFQVFNLKDNKNYCVKSLPDLRIEYQSLHHEVNILKKINHPNVIKTHGFLVAENCRSKENLEGIITEYFEGLSFPESVKLGKLTLTDILKILHGIAMGLDELHNNGIIHRDLKYNNVLVNPNDLQVKIIDLGVALASDNSHSKYHIDCENGSLWYEAPELKESEASFSSDIYSFGLLFYEIIAEGFPTYNTPIALRHISPFGFEVSEEFDAAFKLFCHIDPQKRPSSKEVIQILLRLQNSLTVRSDNQLDQTSRKSYFKLGHFENFEKLMNEISRKIIYAEEYNIKRLDGFIEDPEKSKFLQGNDETYISFELDGRHFKIYGDTSIESLKTLINEFKKYSYFGVENLYEFLEIVDLPDVQTALRLKCNFDKKLKKYRACGFYCYEIKDDNHKDAS